MIGPTLKHRLRDDARAAAIVSAGNCFDYPTWNLSKKQIENRITTEVTDQISYPLWNLLGERND